MSLSPKKQTLLPSSYYTAVDVAEFTQVPEASFHRYCSELGIRGDGQFRGAPVFSIYWARAFKAIAPLMQKAGRLARSGNEAHAAAFRAKAKEIMLSKIPAAPTAPAPQASKAAPPVPAIKAAPPVPSIKAAPAPSKRPKVRTLSAEEAEKIRKKFFNKNK